MQCASAASGVIPHIAVIPGTCAGSAAVVAGMFDFIIISETKGTVSFNAPFVLGSNEAGKSAFVSESGLAALTGTGDGDCIAKAKLLLSYLPMNNQEGTVLAENNDDINRLVDLSAYTASENAADLIGAVADNGSFLELYSAYGKEIMTGLMTLGGTVVGIIASQKCENGGILTAHAARKASRMLTFCDSFHIPVVTVLNSKGPDVSLEAESSTYASELAKLAFAYSSAKTPLITVIAGEAYGAVFSLMGAKALGADVVFALETAKVGVMPASSAVAFLWNDQISEEISREDLEKQWDETVGSPVAAASAGEIDDIIGAAELRQRIAGAVMMLSAKSKKTPARRHINMPL